MRVLFVLGHPAHVHFFKNAVGRLGEKKVEVGLAALGKENTVQLLDSLGVKYSFVSGLKKGLLWKALNLPLVDYRLLRFAWKFKPDLMAGIGGAGMYATHVAKILGCKSLMFTDTEEAGLINKLGFPFAGKVCTPACFYGKVNPKKHLSYNGFHELAYLHPKYFKPNPKVLEYDGLKEGEIYFIVRISSWDSSHDLNTKGFRNEKELEVFLEKLGEYGRVLLSSEVPLSEKFREYEIKTPIHLIHHLLYYASAYVGEGATMASEAGILGVPWVWISRGQRRGYLEEQENKYALGFNVKTPEEAVEKVKRLVAGKNAGWLAKKERLLKEKTDVTDWVVDRIIEEGKS